ncbi:hypothetical protein BBJ28_00002904 [Nothophytophthora sp. Chile5]|nr:hypothetical protein BBJ28_00002904 [Nothophytophthora sp. Chile5]
MADSADESSGSSSSSDSVLIPMPLNQLRRKKLRAQLQEDQRREKLRSQQRSGDADASSDSKQPDDRAKEGELVVCAGPCISAFHLRCLPPASRASASEDGAWLCPSCRSKTHACFHCKQTGVELLAGDDERTASTATAADASRPVRKCRALSCGKFYHQDCITQFPLARIAGTHFICPLHTCAKCIQSGGQQEAVRCMRCPVAYHASCLPSDCVRHITSKLIICPKHAGEAKERPAAVAEHESTAAGAADAAWGETTSARPQQMEKEDDAMSEASAISGTSSSKKRDKREKREKKKKKKKKKKAKRKEMKERLAALGGDSLEHRDAVKDEESSKKRKHLKREVSAEPSDSGQRSDRSNPSTPARSQADPDSSAVATPSSPIAGTTNAGAIRSPPSSFALFESPATASKRIQERLVEALGQSDDDEEEVTVSPVSNERRSSSQPVVPEETAGPTSVPDYVGDESIKAEREKVSVNEQSDVEEKPEPQRASPPAFALGTNPVAGDEAVGARPSLDKEAASVKLEQRKSRQENDSQPGDSRDGAEKDNKEQDHEQQPLLGGELKLEIPTSPSASVLIPSSSAVAATTSDAEAASGEDEGDDEGPNGSATPSVDAPSSAISSLREAEAAATGTPSGGSRSTGQGKKKKKSKSKAAASVQRALKRSASGEEKSEKSEKSGKSESSEAKWVQCDSCKKWRTVPKDFDLNAMPKHWYCNMNTWDLAFASCAVAEEVLKLNPSPQATSSSADRRNKAKVKTKSKPAATGAGGTGASDGGGSSTSSGSVSLKKTAGSAKGSTTDMTALEEKEKTGKSSKSKDKLSKKRKSAKQLKEKYREVKWVQCESTQCGKWRVVPSSINFDRLPAVWYCHLNTWAPELAKCSAPNPVEVDAFLLKQAKKEANGSARPSKKVKAMSSSSGDATPAAPLLPIAGGGGNTPLSGALLADYPSSVTGKAAASKHGKGSKVSTPPVSASGTGGRAFSTSSTGTPRAGGSAESSTVSSMERVAASSGGVSGSASGGPTGDGGPGGSSSGNNNSGAPSSSSKGSKGRAHSGGSGSTTSGIKKTVLEWAQCEKCNKWRKLPQHIKSSTLPDKWYCSMNHWDPSHAKCSIAEEADQEPLATAPSYPGSPWHKGGGGHGGQRPRRGKLSYSELLYGSTGQLRKAYTPESSTLSFEYEGTTYYRDDQYKHSSMYVSPAAMAAAATMAGWSDRFNGNEAKQETSGEAAATNVEEISTTNDLAATTAPQASVDHVAALVLDNMDLRRRRSVSELFDAVNSASAGGEAAASGLVSLALVTAALGQLEHRGLVEKVADPVGESEREQRARKRRKTAVQLPGLSAFSGSAHYRKMPTRPLKASKVWQFGTNVVALLPLED